MPERERDDRPVQAPDPPGTPVAPDPPHGPGEIDLPATFGKYFLTEKLATGGMAEIYLAKIVGPGGFEKQLVIKQIHPRLTGQRHFVDLFVAEAKTLVTLAHGNIVPVYELGVIDDTYFIAMEYIDGPTLYRLTEILRRRDARMAPAVATWITARIVEGLDYAHRKGEGVIHRDLSPRNVMLSRDGEVKLVDFGIAVTLGAAGDDDSHQSAPTGSFPYMSPEQVRREPLTVQTDLFTVGVLLWEMLVGHRLFAHADPDATLRAVTDGDIPRPSAENPEVPARLDEVVMRALERDTAARWPSAGDLLAALQRYLYSLDDPPGPRDVAALVARYCPPSTRRLPTHHDDLAEHEPPGDATQPRPRAATADIQRPGPATAVIPRDGTGPRGKRPSRARTESFATHVELEQMFERAAPSSADDGAIKADDSERTDGDGRRTSDRDNAETTTPTSPTKPGPAATAADDAPIARPDQPPFTLPGRTAPSSGMLMAAAFGALALGGVAVYVFYRGRGAVDRPDAALRRDAVDPTLGSALGSTPDSAPPATLPPDAVPDPALDAAPSLPDAREPLLPAPDAGPVLPPRDAGPRPPHADAREPGELTARIDAGPARPTGTATLTVGAIPWGTVLLDGKPIGRTPIDRLTVPAGHHVVSVTFGGEDPPRTLSYPVDLTAGDSKDIVADFTRP